MQLRLPFPAWLIFLLLLAACVQPTADEVEGPRPAIAVVLPGSKADASWSAAAYRALQTAAAHGAGTAYAEGVSDVDAPRVLQAYIAQGFDLIVAHSYSYQDAVFALAAEHPTVHFAWAGGIGRTARNVADYDQPFYEAAYLVGILAGAVSKSGNLGALYGFDIPACHAIGAALLAGANTSNPGARLLVTETGDWEDVSKATTMGLAQAEQHDIDFWVACGEGPTLGSIAVARATGGFATGYASDMAALAPDVVLVSMVWQLDALFATLAQAAAQGNFQGSFYRLGFQAGAMDAVINPALQEHIPLPTQQAFAQARQAMQRGTLHAPYIPH